MGVEVNVHLQVFVLVCILTNCLLSSPYGWLITPLRLIIKSIQILAQCVKSVVSTGNTIWIQCRNDLKHVVFSKKPALLTF